MKNKPISQKNEPDWIDGQAGKPDIPKYSDKSFRVFSTLLAVGLQPTAQCRRVANPAGAMLENLWSGT